MKRSRPAHRCRRCHDVFAGSRTVARVLQVTQAVARVAALLPPLVLAAAFAAVYFLVLAPKDQPPATGPQPGPVAEGNVGAGAGATVGKALGADRAMKSGVGTASVRLEAQEGGTWDSARALQLVERARAAGELELKNGSALDEGIGDGRQDECRADAVVTRANGATRARTMRAGGKCARRFAGAAAGLAMACLAAAAGGCGSGQRSGRARPAEGPADAAGEPMIHVDLDPSVFNRNLAADLVVEADARAFLAARGHDKDSTRSQHRALPKVEVTRRARGLVEVGVLGIAHAADHHVVEGLRVSVRQIALLSGRAPGREPGEAPPPWPPRPIRRRAT